MRRLPSCSVALFAVLRRLTRDSRGATAIEYGLIVSLIVIAAMASIVSVADVTTGMWNNVSAEVISAH